MDKRGPEQGIPILIQNWRFFLAIAVPVFAAVFSLGANFGQYAGMPGQVKNISDDVRGLACMMVSVQEMNTTRYCEGYLSAETRDFIGKIRENSTNFPIPQSVVHITQPHVWVKDIREESPFY